MHTFVYRKVSVYIVFRYSYLFVYFQTFLIFNTPLMEISPELMGIGCSFLLILNKVLPACLVFQKKAIAKSRSRNILH
jgi:hypothetical protein